MNKAGGGPQPFAALTQSTWKALAWPTRCDLSFEVHLITHSIFICFSSLEKHLLLLLVVDKPDNSSLQVDDMMS